VNRRALAAVILAASGFILQWGVWLGLPLLPADEQWPFEPVHPLLTVTWLQFSFILGSAVSIGGGVMGVLALRRDEVRTGLEGSKCLAWVSVLWGAYILSRTVIILAYVAIWLFRRGTLLD
jgi:hypothetical protein